MATALHVEPEIGVPPVTASLSGIPLLERARLACNTIRALYPDEYDAPPDEEELTTAREAFSEIVSSHNTPRDQLTALAANSPATLRHLNALLSEYDQELVDSAVRIREYVKNKLLEETTNPDGKIRIRALELLGKIKDVGLFSDKLEITHKSKSDEELTHELTQRIERFMGTAVLVEGPESLAEEMAESEEVEAEAEAALMEENAPELDIFSVLGAKEEDEPVSDARNHVRNHA